MYRYKRGVKVPYNRQGYIYFTSLLYKEMCQETRTIIDDLCIKTGGEYADALKEFVTTDASATALSLKYHIDRKAIYRVVRKYYEQFPKEL